MRLQESLAPSESADTPDKVAGYIRPLLLTSLRYNQDVENLGIVFMNTRRRPIGMEIISNGTLDTLLVHPREVFKPAIVIGAAAIVIFHNHPSGDPCPSEADIKVTRDMIRAGQLLKIDVLDHIILGDGKHSSLRELGYFYS